MLPETNKGETWLDASLFLHDDGARIDFQERDGYVVLSVGTVAIFIHDQKTLDRLRKALAVKGTSEPEPEHEEKDE